MVKRILLSIVLLLVIAYLVVAVTAFNRKPTSQVCQDVELVIKDTVYAGFITKKEVATLLEKKGISPIGKDLERVRTKTLERELAKHPLIDQVECYKTPSGKLCIEVTQRTPILRVMSANGENYYLDNKGTVMPPDAKCVAHLAVVTGNVEKSFAMRDLYKFGVFLQKNSFWNAQIEQIHVLPGKNIELVPRVGDHLIYLGKIAGFEKKLKRALPLISVLSLPKSGYIAPSKLRPHLRPLLLLLYFEIQLCHTHENHCRQDNHTAKVSFLLQAFPYLL